MKLLVRLYADVASNLSGVPGEWPAEVQAVDDSMPDPGDGRLVMTPEEFDEYRLSVKSLYDAWSEQTKLPGAKEAKLKAIDTRTVELINQGFTYAGKVFSLSERAQNTWTGLYTVRNEPVLTYPVKINLLDDSGTHDLVNAADVQGFYLTAVGTYRARLDSGTGLKDQVRAATTLAGIEAVQDNR